MIFKTSISHFIFRLESDCAEMVHAARGLDILWHYRPITDVVYNHEDLTSCPLRTGSSLAQSGLCPCLLVNIGSAMTIVSVSKVLPEWGGGNLTLRLTECQKALAPRAQNLPVRF